MENPICCNMSISEHFFFHYYTRLIICKIKQGVSTMRLGLLAQYNTQHSVIVFVLVHSEHQKTLLTANDTHHCFQSDSNRKMS